MPWCPNCKAEYVEGMTVCIDCGTELVDELPSPSEIISFMEIKKEKVAQKFVQFLTYSNVEGATYEYDEDSGQWVVLIKESTLKKVEKLYKAFYSVELEKQLSDLEDTDESDKESETDSEPVSDSELVSEEYSSDSNEEDMEESSDAPEDYTEAAEDVTDSSDDSDKEDYTHSPDDKFDSMFDQEELKEIIESSEKKPVISSAYVKKEEQYKDLKSTASTFILVSLLGIVFLILNAVGILHIFNNILPFIVMGILFLVFLIIGFQTYASSKKIGSQISEENNITEAINTWLTQNVTLELLDSLTDSDEKEEIRFFHKLEKMKEMITGQFGEMDDAYLDRLVEEYYNNHFEQ